MELGLRNRRSGTETELVEPLDSAEQDKIVMSFQEKSARSKDYWESVMLWFSVCISCVLLWLCVRQYTHPLSVTYHRVLVPNLGDLGTAGLQGFSAIAYVGCGLFVWKRLALAVAISVLPFVTWGLTLVFFDIHHEGANSMVIPSGNIAFLLACMYVERTSRLVSAEVARLEKSKYKYSAP